jgi:hypothetical protein
MCNTASKVNIEERISAKPSQKQKRIEANFIENDTTEELKIVKKALEEREKTCLDLQRELKHKNEEISKKDAQINSYKNKLGKFLNMFLV